MKSIIRLTALLALAFGALFPVAAVAVNAQATNCFGLPDADCQLLQAAGSSDAAAKMSSFVVDYTLNASVAGTGTSDGKLSITGSGPFSADPAVLADLKASATSGAAMDPAAMVKAVSAFTMANTIKASANFNGKDEGGNFEFRIVGGNLYYMGDQTTQGKWMVVNLATALQGMTKNMGSMMPSAGAKNPVMDPKIQADAEALGKVKGLVKAESGDGPAVDGVATRKLTFNVDLAALFAAPEFKTLMTDATAQSGQAMEPAQFDSMIQSAQVILKDTKIQVTELVGTSDKLLHGFGLTIAVKVDPTYAALLTNNSDAKELNVNLDLNVQFSKIGQPVKVDPVADAQSVDMGGTSGAAPTPAK